LEASKEYSSRSFWVITIFSMVLLTCIGGGLLYGIDLFLIRFTGDISDDIKLENLGWLVLQFELASNGVYKIVLPLIAGIGLLLAWGLWAILRVTMTPVFKINKDDKGNQKSLGRKKDFIDQKIEKERKRRLYLHSLSVLQRDGRLLDFFCEDLTDYDDEQIGMAVRSIHEDCKKSINKYIDLKPVLDKQEGYPIVIEQGFDMDSIKLIGNVKGNPPFEGVVKHPGWKAGKKEIPKLSEVQDSSIISPAEVELK